MPKKPSKSRTTNREIEDMIAQCEIALSVLETGVNAGLVAGIHPYAFEAPTSFWFMEAAGQARCDSKVQMSRWREKMTPTFNLIVVKLISFASSYSGELRVDEGEENEFEHLFKPFHRELISELTLKRDNKSAETILAMAMSALNKFDIEPMSVEAAFLTLWFKVAALAGDQPLDFYLTIRRSSPIATSCYDDVAFAALKS